MGAICCSGRQNKAEELAENGKCRRKEHECTLEILDSAKNQTATFGKRDFLKKLKVSKFASEESERQREGDVYSKDADGYLIVFSITDEASYKEVQTIYDDLREIKQKQKVPAVLCGNKCDLHEKRAITKEQSHQMAEGLGLLYFETSAKEDINIEKVYQHLVSEEIPVPSSSVKIAMCGSGGVGKSSIMTRYVTGSFVDEYDQSIEDSYRKRITVRHKHPFLNKDKKVNLRMVKSSAEKNGADETRAAVTSPAYKETDGAAAAAVESSGS